MISPLHMPPPPPDTGGTGIDPASAKASTIAAATAKSAAISSVISYLDSFKPLLLQNMSILKVAIARFEYLAKRVVHPNPALDLLAYEINSSAEVHEFFPIRPKGFDMILGMLSFESTILGHRVLLLDLLTLLVIVLRGSLETKTEYLFRWYNTNGTGIMTEDEHIVFITRLSKVLVKINFLNSVDVTEEDAKHIAFTSRLNQEAVKRMRRAAGVTSRPGTQGDSAPDSLPGTKPTTPALGMSGLMGGAVSKDKVEKIVDKGDEGLRIDPKKGSVGFHPGLTKELFDRWVKYSVEGQMYSNFVRCLDRLVDMLRVLDVRLDAIGDIVLRKQHHKENAPAVPHMDILPNLKVNYSDPVHVICRGQTHINMIVTSRLPIHDPSTQVYVKCEQLETVPNPLYPIPFNTMKTIKASDSYLQRENIPHCCDRIYTLTAYYRNGFASVNHPSGSKEGGASFRGPSAYYSTQVKAGSIMQVHLEGLDPGRRYNITVYTDAIQYPQIEASTIPKEERSSKKVSIALLPAILSVDEAADFVRHTPVVADADATVYSGSLCDLDKEIQAALLFAEDGVRNTFHTSFVNSFTSLLEHKLESQFKEKCDFLYSMKSGVSSANQGGTEGSTVAHTNKQVLYHNGMGPWGTPNILHKIKRRLYHDSIRTDKNGDLCIGADDSTENIWLRNMPRNIHLAENIRRELEYKYREIVKPLSPYASTLPGGEKAPCFSWHQGPFELIFLENNGESESSLGTNVKSVVKLISSRVNIGTANTNAGKKLESEEEKGDSGGNMEQCLVLVMRSPLDVMNDNSHVVDQAILQYHKYQSPAIPVTPRPEADADTNTAAIDQEAVEEELVEIPVMATIVDEPTEEQKLENAKADEKAKKENAKAEKEAAKAIKREEEGSDYESSDEDDSDEEDSDEASGKDSDDDSDVNIDDLNDSDLDEDELAERYEKKRLAKEEEDRITSEFIYGEIMPDWVPEEAVNVANDAIQDIMNDRALAKRKIMNGGYIPTAFWKKDKDAANFRYKMRKYNEAHGLKVVYDDPHEEGNDIIDDREELGDANIRPISNVDADFEEFISILMQWLEQPNKQLDGLEQKTQTKRRCVQLVSTGWVQGANFEIISKSRNLRLTHTNLLPTATKYNANKCDSQGYRARGHTDNDHLFIPEFEHVGVSLEEKLQTEEMIRTETLLDRIVCSLPDDCTFSLLSASQLRSLVLERNPESLSSDKTISQIVDSFLPINRVTLKAEKVEALSSDSPLGVGVAATSVVSDNLTPLEMRDGPRIVRLQSDEVLITARTEGYGRVKCSIYEVPFEMDYDATLSVCATNRKQLRKVGSVTKRALKSSELFFPFKNLAPYTAYCICIDLTSSTKEKAEINLNSLSKSNRTALISRSGTDTPVVEQKDGNDDVEKEELSDVKEVEADADADADKIEKSKDAVEVVSTYIDPLTSEKNPIPMFAHFRTLTDGSGRSSSMVISTVSDADYALPSHTLSKIDELLSGTRPPAATVHLLHNLSGLDQRDLLGPAKPGKMDMQKLHRRASVSHLQPEHKKSYSNHYGNTLAKFDGIIHPQMRNMDPAINLTGMEKNRVFEAFGASAFQEELDEIHSYRSLHSLLNISFNGFFCRVTPRDSSWNCLRKVSEFMNRLDLWHPEVKNVTLFVHRPLLRYLKKSQLPKTDSRFRKPAYTVNEDDEEPPQVSEESISRAHKQAKWAYDCKNKADQDDPEEYSELCSIVINSVLQWKACGEGRDCQVIAIAQVKTLKVAVFGYHLRSRAAAREERKEMRARMAEEATAMKARRQLGTMDDDGTLGTRGVIPYDLMTSSVAYTADASSLAPGGDDGTIATSLNGGAGGDDATMATKEPSSTKLGQADQTGEESAEEAAVDASTLKASVNDDAETKAESKVHSKADSKADAPERETPADGSIDEASKVGTETIGSGGYEAGEAAAGDMESNVAGEESGQVSAAAESTPGVFKGTIPQQPSEDEDASKEVEAHVDPNAPKIFKGTIPVFPPEGEEEPENILPPDDKVDEKEESNKDDEEPVEQEEEDGPLELDISEDDDYHLEDDLSLDTSLDSFDAIEEQVDLGPQEPLVTIRHIILPVWTSMEEFPDEFPNYEEVAKEILPPVRRARLEAEGRIPKEIPVKIPEGVENTEEAVPVTKPEPTEVEPAKAMFLRDRDTNHEAVIVPDGRQMNKPAVWTNPEEDDQYLFPSGTYLLAGSIEFRFDNNPTDLERYNISPLLKRMDLYGKAIDMMKPQAEIAVYLFDIFIRPGEGTQSFDAMGLPPMPGGSVMGGSIGPGGSIMPGSVTSQLSLEELEIASQVPDDADDMSVHHFPQPSPTHVYDKDFHYPMPVPNTTSTGQTHSSEWHNLLPRSFVSNMDLAEIIVGPVIGELSTTTAKVLLEFNMDLREIAIVLRPIGRNDISTLNKDGSDRDTLEGNVKTLPLVVLNEEEQEEADAAAANAAATLTAAPASEGANKRKMPKKPPKAGFVYNEFGQEIEIPVPNAIIIQKGIKAYKVFTIDFDNLRPNTSYSIHIPELKGRQKLGYIRTLSEYPRFSEILLHGGTPIHGLDSVDIFMSHSLKHQVPDLRQVLREMNILYPSYVRSLVNERTEHTAPVSIVGKHGISNEQKIPHNERQARNCWGWMGEFTQRPVSDYSMTVHMGSQTILTQHFTKIVQDLMDQAHRLELPLFDASPVGAYYFNQFEEKIKDSFRILWAVPDVRDALSSGSHMFLFLAEYLLSFEGLPKRLTSIEDGATEMDIKLLKVIRTVYEQNFQKYITPLYNWDPEIGHHAKIQRVGPLAYIMLDVVSGRKKIKKKKTDEVATESTGEKTKVDKKKKKDIEWSSGFLDKAQWKLIKDVSEDDTVTSIVLLSYKPFMSLYDLPNEFKEPTEIKKGEMMEWCPTYSDIRSFLLYFITWMTPVPGKPDLHKNFVMVGSHTFPYATQFQDMRSGTKIQQICVGRSGTEAHRISRKRQTPMQMPTQTNEPVGESQLESREYDYDELNGFRVEDVVLSGRIGSRMRFVHKFTELDNLKIDPDRNSHGTNSQDKDRELIKSQILSLLKPSYATLDFTFDSWRALGNFRLFEDSTRSFPLPSDDLNAAILLVGPILGPPRVYDMEQINVSDGQKFTDSVFEVGITVETDRDTTLAFQVRHSLRGDITTFTFDVIGRRPFLCKIGPLEPNARFDAKLVSGVRETTCLQSEFVLSTLVNATEANVVLINCELVPGELPKADFPKDVLRRMQVPFNGLTVTVHMNSCPDDIPKLLDELKRLDKLINGMQRCFELKHLTVEFYHVLSDVMETIRQAFRRHFSRPSYCELLRNHFTLLMQTHNIFGEVDLEAAVEEDEEDEEEEEDDDQSLPDDLPPDDMMRLVKLMSMRIFQEYVEQSNNPDKNVFIAKEMHEDDIVDVRYLSEKEQKRIADEDDRKLQIMIELDIESSHHEEFGYKKFNPKADPVKVVFKQWLMGLEPASPMWTDYVTPNRRVIIERTPCVLKKNLPKVLAMFKKPAPIDIGSRIVVIDGNVDGSGLDLAFTPKVKTGSKFHVCAKKWLYPNPLHPEGEIAYLPLEPGDDEPEEVTKDCIRDDRRICFVSPCSKWGTQKLKIATVPEYEHNDGPHSYIHTLESMYRSNEAERAQKILQIEAESENALKDQTLPKATTKKAKEKQREAEELRKKQKMKEFQDAMNKFTPDGYIIVECNTHLMPVPEGYGKDQPPDAITTMNVQLLPSVPGGLNSEKEEEIYREGKVSRPSPYDYIDLPEWIAKFFPSKDGVFAQDEVLLWMRQNKITSRILHILEGDEVVGKIIELYEQSRLSELSRPEDLREIDMSLPGVTGRFLKDIVDRLWKDVLPAETKELLVPVNDDFLRSFLLSRALPEPETALASSEAFAKGIQYALTLAVAMKISLTMAQDPRYHHILREPDAATVTAQYMADKDEKHRLGKERERIRMGENPLTEEEEEALAKEKKKEKMRKAAAKAKDKGKSDRKKGKKKPEKKEGEGGAAAEEEEAEVSEPEPDSDGPNYDTDGGESDLEALDKENNWLEAAEGRADEEEEINERMNDMDETEQEARDAHRETLGLDQPEEEEAEEEEDDEAELDAMDEDEKKLYYEKKEEAKLELLRSKEKSSAQLNREAEATFELQLLDVLQLLTSNLVEEAFDGGVDAQVRDEVYDIEQEEKLKAVSLPTPQSRVGTAKLHISRMANERRNVRRNVGPRVMHLSK